MNRGRKRGVRRILSVSQQRIVVDDLQAQRRLDHDQMAAWVSSLAPWQVVAHLTWRDRVGEDGIARGISSSSAASCYERFMRKQLAHLSYFYAVEPNPSRYGTHVHALWADARGVYRKEVWASWFKRFGRAKIEPVRDFNDVSSYLSKYVTKRADRLCSVWWNVKLQWHRVQALNDSEFKLQDDEFGRPSGARSIAVSLSNNSGGDAAAGGCHDPVRAPRPEGPLVAWCVNEQGLFEAGL